MLWVVKKTWQPEVTLLSRVSAALLCFWPTVAMRKIGQDEEKWRCLGFKWLV